MILMMFLPQILDVSYPCLPWLCSTNPCPNEIIRWLKATPRLPPLVSRRGRKWRSPPAGQQPNDQQQFEELRLQHHFFHVLFCSFNTFQHILTDSHSGVLVVANLKSTFGNIPPAQAIASANRWTFSPGSPAAGFFSKLATHQNTIAKTCKSTMPELFHSLFLMLPVCICCHESGVLLRSQTNMTNGLQHCSLKWKSQSSRLGPLENTVLDILIIGVRGGKAAKKKGLQYVTVTHNLIQFVERCRK